MYIVQHVSNKVQLYAALQQVHISYAGSDPQKRQRRLRQRWQEPRRVTGGKDTPVTVTPTAPPNTLIQPVSVTCSTNGTAYSAQSTWLSTHGSSDDIQLNRIASHNGSIRYGRTKLPVLLNISAKLHIDF